MTKSPDKIDLTITHIEELKVYRELVKSLAKDTRNQDVKFKLDQEIFRIRLFLKQWCNGVGVNKRKIKKCLRCKNTRINRFIPFHTTLYHSKTVDNMVFQS